MVRRKIRVLFKTGVPVGRLTVEAGTCYVVIAMRNMFVEGELPGETPTTSAGSDISSFTQLYQYAEDVYTRCTRPGVSNPGWYPAGRHPPTFNQTASPRTCVGGLH